MHDFLRAVVRVQDGRNPEPTAGIFDSRIMKFSAVVHPADVQDRDGIGLMCEGIKDQCPLLATVYADGGYAGRKVTVACTGDLVVVKRTEPGFVVLAKRWIVERTFAWFTQNRRLVKDYEDYDSTVETFSWLVMIRLMLRRLRP